MKRMILGLCLVLSACGPGGGLLIPGISQSSLDLPVDTVENWDVVSSKGDKSSIATVKTATRDFKFNGKFPTSFFGIPVDVPVAGTLHYGEDGKATLKYSAPLPVTVKALYSIRDGGNTIELTTTESSPAWAAIGEKTRLERKDITQPS
jgi:hypothetical protein